MDDAGINEAVVVGYPITDWTDNWYTEKAARENDRLYGVGMLNQFADGAEDALREMMAVDGMLGFRLGAVCPYDEMWERFDYGQTWLRDAIAETDFWEAVRETDALVQIMAHTSQMDQALELVETYPDLAYAFDHYAHADAADDPVTTNWMEIPRDFGAANASLQLRTVPEDDDGVDPDDWADYAFETTLTVESEQAGVVFRAQDPDNFYMWQFADETHRFDQDLLRPHVRASGGWTVLDEIPLGEYVDNVEGQEHDIRIEANGDEITTWLNGQEVDSRTDDTHATGRIGFRQPPLDDLSRSILVDTITSRTSAGACSSRPTSSTTGQSTSRGVRSSTTNSGWRTRGSACSNSCRT
jgi:hypothetical protein